MTAGIRGGMGLASMILLAGSIVLMFFVVLSGVTNSTPLNKTWFLRADYSYEGSGRTTSQWTYFYMCGDNNQNCGAPVPALPLGYAWLGHNAEVPGALTGSHGKGTTSTYYYYMWRFGWVFYLMGLTFNVLGFFLALLAPCSRLASGISGTITGFALFWFTLAAALMTTVFVKARDRFRDAGVNANIGEYAFGFTWGAWAALFLASLFLFLGCGLGGRKETTTTTRTTSSRGFFRRQRSRRSNRGSLFDGESSRRVKDEYA